LGDVAGSSGQKTHQSAGFGIARACVDWVGRAAGVSPADAWQRTWGRTMNTTYLEVNDTIIQTVPPFTPARVMCPVCRSAQARLVWKAVRQPAKDTTASYVCDLCRNFWTAPARP
jgi:hypothetical protein